MVADAFLQVRLLRVPRSGTTLEACQDAADFDLDRQRFALADGATESWNAGLWARLLVEAYVGIADPEPEWASWLPPLQQRWQQETDRAPGELDWFQEERYRLGAYATFLGLCLTGQPDPDDGGFDWVAVAVGDTCLFQVRNDHLVTTFPLGQSGEFTSEPWLLGARGSAVVAEQHGLSVAGRVLPGDRLLLMTDALSQWLLARVEAGGKPWRQMQAILDSPQPVEGFALWVGGLRDRNEIRNDDTTLLLIEVK